MAAAPIIPLLAAIGTGASAVGAAASLFRKAPQVQAPTMPTRNRAADQVVDSDRVSRRRGAAANLLLGAGGAESSAGGKSALGT